MILKTRPFSHFFPAFLRFFCAASVLLCFAACGSNTEKSASHTAQTDDNTAQTAENSDREIILFFGDSLTAGLGLDSIQEAYPALIQEKIDSLGLPYRCVNAGLSGETSAGGLERIDWVLQEPVSIFVLALAANDGLRGLPPANTRANLEAILEKVRAANPDAQLVLAGMKIPPSMGQQYFTEFEAIFPKLAEEQDLTLIPFLLDQVAGIESLNQSDGVHPTAEGQRIMAENVWSVLEPLLQRP